MSLLTVLLIVFVVLKMTHAVAWSWLWVLAPGWIPAALGVGYWAAALVAVLLRAKTKK